jgi:chemosensory pili system protein ChpA (sensor histidine kinase/response regulator)
VRASFKLAELLPVDDTIEQERESLSAPSVKLMRTVAAAIKEDLSKVKDVLDIFVRRGGGQSAELLPQLELLKKISDTLGVLGLGELRQRVQDEIQALSQIIQDGKPPSEESLVRVAGVLLSVEDSLDDQLVRLILPVQSAEAAADAPADQDHEFRQVSEAVLRECIVNLARIKEAVSAAVQKPSEFSAQGLDNVPQLLRGITAGLLMLGKGRAVALMDAIGKQVRMLIEPGAPAPDAIRLERVADAIVSIEYYMETLQNGRTDPWYMLDNAETCLKTLADDETLSRVPNLNLTSSEAAKTMKLDPSETIAMERTKRAHAATNPLIVVPEPEAVDPQFVELFIEEAKEEIASVQKAFPLWDQNPMDLEALSSMRRSFHTLKGSGRMVGARAIAEFAWSIENLLNRIIDKTLSRTPGMMALLRNSVAALPQLVEQLETGRPVATPTEALMTRAFAYADGRDPEQAKASIAPEDRAGSDANSATTSWAGATAAQKPPMDAALHDIYAKETSSHLTEIREYLRKRTGQPAPHDLPESVYRAIHTLSGSSKMAEARHGIRITEPLNHVMRKVFDSGHGLSDAGLATLEQSVRSIENVLSHINESTGFFSDQPELLVRFRDLEAEVDAMIANAARDTSASAMVPALVATSAPAMPAPTTPAPATPAQVQPAASPSPQPVEEFDHEIANIYSEEATELLEAAQGSLTVWNKDRGDKQPVAELQRQLHTLKGGARMAGVSAMGDLSHELETLVLQIDSGAVAGDDHAHAVMQTSLDELSRMRDLVSAGRLPGEARDLIAQIRGLANQPAATPTATVRPAAAPASAAIAPVAAPAPTVAPAAPPTAGVVQPAAARAPDAPPARAALEASLEPAASEEAPSSLELSSAPVLPGREAPPVERVEMARVDAELLDTMLNNAGEVSIFRARLDQQVNSIDFNLAELARTVTRLKEQLRGLEMETEAQVLHRHHDIEPRRDDFDPLELDRYSALQQFSRALAETSGDVASIQGLLETLTREAQSLLTQQARVITELQNSLMRTRMVPFQRHVQRLTRLVRQAANDTGKRAELAVQGAAAELDRQMLERMVAPLEHMLRNSVVHGIEPPDRRAQLGKPDVGRISISLERDGAEIVIIVADDGAGINVKLIREKAIALGLIDAHAKLTDEEAVQLILEPGFSTAGHVTQAAGRGVGMDVVATEVKKLGGGLFIDSTYGKGSRFTIRLPFTLAISQALIVRVAEETYALPLATVEGVVRLPRNIVARHLGKDAPLFEYGGQKYRFQHLGSFVGLGATRLPDSDVSMSVVLIRAGEHSTALVTDELVGSREIVVKSLGPQISAIRGIAGATILGDGRIVLILDMGSLVRSEWRARPTETVVLDQRDRRTFALVVDDSITVRRVTQRLLERNGMRVLTAKDGVDAVSLLQENLPDIILLDIEMPRMDGYEVAAHVRNDPRLKQIPIVMITSRVSEKHRARAIELGVDDYLGKPYQESQLLDAIEPLVNRRSAVAR